MIENIKKEALDKDVPIIKDGGLLFLLDLIKKENSKEILELGTAVGYSSLNMSNLADDIHIDTLEKNEEMYKKAVENIKAENKENQISAYFTPIEDFKTDKMYDLIFVDAAKAQYEKYMEQFLPNLKEDGVMLFDNMIFHGLIYDIDNIKGRGTRALCRKIVKFRENVSNDSRFDIIFNDKVGDGLLVLRRKKVGK